MRRKFAKGEEEEEHRKSRGRSKVGGLSRYFVVGWSLEIFVYRRQRQVVSVAVSKMNGLEEETMAPQTFLYGERTSVGRALQGVKCLVLVFDC